MSVAHVASSTLAFVLLLPKLLLATLSFLLHALSSRIHPDPHPLPFRRKLGHHLVRAYGSRLTLEEYKLVLGSSDKTCTQYLRPSTRHPQPHTRQVLSDGTILHWSGIPTAKKTLVYFHGGGYVTPINFGCLKFLRLLQTRLRDVSLCIACYDLAPASRYPRQLSQACNVIHHLTGPLQRSPPDILLAGDSAGANLILALLIHAINPRPAVPALSLAGPFAGAALISPWVKMEPPEIKNGEISRDIIFPRNLKAYAEAFLGDSEPDPWNSPLRCEGELWGRLQVGSLMIVYGGEELMRDDIKQFCGRIDQSYAGRFENVVDERGVHGEFVASCMFGDLEGDGAFERLCNFIGNVAEGR